MAPDKHVRPAVDTLLLSTACPSPPACPSHLGEQLCKNRPLLARKVALLCAVLLKCE